MDELEQLKDKVDKYEQHIEDLQDEVFKLEDKLDSVKLERDRYREECAMLKGGNLLIEQIPTGYRVRTMDSPIKTAEGISMAVALIEFLSEHHDYFPIIQEAQAKEIAEAKAA